MDIKPGTLVRSRFRAGWFGRVIGVIGRKGTTPLVIMETICTADGRPHRKPYRKRYSAGWLEVVEALPERYEALAHDVACEKARRRRTMQIRKR